MNGGILKLLEASVLLQALGKELGTVCTKVVVEKAATPSGIDAFCQLMCHRALPV